MAARMQSWSGPRDYLTATSERRTIKIMKFLVTIQRDEDGWVVAECPALPGCVSQGASLEDALANIRDAIELSLQTRQELGIATQVELAEVDVDVPSR